jgi:hypothetical protein
MVAGFCCGFLAALWEQVSVLFVSALEMERIEHLTGRLGGHLYKYV